jgi:hypothetical protein
MAKSQKPFVLGDVNANVPGDVFAYGKGKAPGSAPIKSARLWNATPRSIEAWLVKHRIKTTTATVHVVQLSPFDRGVIGTVEYSVKGGKLTEVKGKGK